ncbi:MAG: hypothetical protein K1X83_01860 [Oligoflexia bacterium]|nr:hypothetical protein [Oligoflexia bacterium]
MSEIARDINGRGYRVDIQPAFGHVSAQDLISLVTRPAEAKAARLGGRGGVSYAQLPGAGAVVIKQYRRGGVFGIFVREVYWRVGALRSEHECRMLEVVRSLGVSAPEAVAVISRGGRFYRTWLITREVGERLTLAELALADEDRARSIIPALVAQMNLLIDNQIFHVDLHPGNVLVGPGASVHLVDFDKAGEFSGSREDLRDKYVFRWRRAVIKHRLPEVLSELVCLGLRHKPAEAARRPAEA